MAGCPSRQLCLVSVGFLSAEKVPVIEALLGELVSFGLLFGVHVVVSVVFGTVADLFKGVETGRRGSVCVDVDHFASLDVLEKSHGCVARIVLHHRLVILALSNIVGWVLEDASLSVRALGRMF